MKLLVLGSSNPKFKTINFKDGLNILAGIQLSDDEKRTINGVGKSFSLLLIHLLLGSKLDKSKASEEKVQTFLSSYGSFYLIFSHARTKYKIDKNFAETCTYVNKIKYNAKQYSEFLNSLVSANSPSARLSFRQIFNVYARRYGGTYYTNVLTQQGRPLEDWYQRFTNLALLGFDTSLLLKKKELNAEVTDLKKAKSSIEKIKSNVDEINLKDIKEERQSLLNDKSNFVIAENYDALRDKADDFTSTLNDYRNKLYEIKSQMVRKRAAMDGAQLVDIDVEQLKLVYDEAKFFFPKNIDVRLNEAKEFHNQLMIGRVDRFKKDISSLQAKHEEITVELNTIEEKRDFILKDLDSKGALSEYNSIAERIRTLSIEIQEIEKYESMLEDFKQKESTLELENAKIRKNSHDYIKQEETKSKIDKIENQFRSLVRQFYVNSGGVFKLENTEDAAYVYDVNVSIKRDFSQGVNEVKIFCYDLLLYELNPNLLGFVAHDGCIFSEMDPRQKTMMFKVVLDHIEAEDLQYFVNIGQSTLEEVLDKDGKIGILSDKYKQEIQGSIIKELYDEESSKWLFGTSFG